MRLKDKVVLVTGTASRVGIGYSIATEMAAEGAFVISTDREEKLQPAGDSHADGSFGTVMALDVTDAENVAEVMDIVWNRYGRLDVLVNNAGICPVVPFLESTNDIWNKTIDVNLTGVFNCSLAAARRMIRDNRRGKIIIISSFCVEYPSMNQTAYSASKGGVYMLAKNMALELAPYYINVNCVAPGAISSTNISAAGDLLLKEMGHSEKMMQMDPVLSDREIPLDERYKLERNLVPYDAARAVIFLASADADHITGQTIFVNGFECIC